MPKIYILPELIIQDRNTPSTFKPPTANKYAQVRNNLASAMTKPRKTQYKSVNQLLKESPLVGSTKLGLNFIA